jgi:hypothetical protein
MNECLRMYPVTLSPLRWTQEPITGPDGRVYPPGPVMVSLYALHHDPELWQDPMTFNPDRFLKDPVPHSFIPFLEGRRMCAGMVRVCACACVLGWFLVPSSLQGPTCAVVVCRHGAFVCVAGSVLVPWHLGLGVCACCHLYL